MLNRDPSKQLKVNSPGTQANRLSVGNRVFGGFSNSAHSGGGLNKSGYEDRDSQARVKRNALMRQMQRFGGK